MRCKAALRYRAPVALCEQRAHTQAVVEGCPLRDEYDTDECVALAARGKSKKKYFVI